MKSLYSPTMFLWQIVGNDGFVWGKITPYSDAASGWAGWALAHPEFGSSVNPITTKGQIMPTTSLLAHPDLKTQQHLSYQD